MTSISSATIPRQIVKLGLRYVRLPISLAEHVTERAGLDISQLPPIAAYDSVEAQAKMTIGRLLGDDVLVEEGSVQERAIRQRRSAADLSDRAEEIRAQADDQLGQRLDRADRSRQQVNRRTEDRKRQIEQEEEKAKAEARTKARQREEAVRQAARTREKAAAAKARQSELARIQAESKALDKESGAVEAERVASTIDETLDEKKAARRNGLTRPAGG